MAAHYMGKTILKRSRRHLWGVRIYHSRRDDERITHLHMESMKGKSVRQITRFSFRSRLTESDLFVTDGRVFMIQIDNDRRAMVKNADARTPQANPADVLNS